MNYSLPLGLLWFTLCLGGVYAQEQPNVSPPAPYAIKVNQPDGSQLEVIARGDAFHHWAETTDGYTIIKTAQGSYEYATLKRGKLVGSGLLAQNPQTRDVFQSGQLSRIPKGLIPPVDNKRQRELLQQTLQSNSSARLGSSGVMPAKGNVKVLAILIEYPDLKHRYDKKTFETFFNGPSDKPTFKSYFQDNSHGKFNPTVEVVGWYEAKNNFEYYGEKHGKARARELVAEAIDAADKDGVDLSQYDNNDDSYVDGIIVIHAGQGAEEGNQTDNIWSHRWTISPKFADGTFVQDYTIQPELRVRYGGTKLVRIGIFCHEFGHLLGLPDLYDTDHSDDKHHGIGEWGLMGLGGWIGEEEYPAGMTAFSKAMLGWGKLQDITGKGGSYELKPAHSNGDIYKIKTPNSNEYFLLENRQRSGTDKYLMGSGLAIWHINTDKTELYPESINVNNRKDRKGVDLEEADGKFDLDERINRGDAGDLFPGSSQQTSFDQSSDPNSDLYDDSGDGKGSNIAIANIKLSGTTISFDYNKKVEKGLKCEDAVAAKEGDNSLPKANYWYTFTLPKEGQIIVTGANAEIYQSCDDKTPLVSSSSNKLTTNRLAKGEKVLIKLGDNQPKSLPLTWKLAVQTQKNDPSLSVDAVSAKTFGDKAFDLKASAKSDGKITFERISGPIELDGSEVKISGAGTAKIKATIEETSTYASSEKEVSFTITKANPALTFAAIEDKTYRDEPFELGASSTPELPIAYKVIRGDVEIKEQTVTIVGVGEVEIEASVAGSDNYNSTKKTQKFEVKKLTQEITFDELDDIVYEKEKIISLAAKSSQDLIVSFSIKEGEAKLDGTTLTILKSGKITVEAQQKGTKNIASAQSVQRSFEVTKAPQEITFAEIGPKDPDDQPFNLEATSNADISVEFKIVKGNATLDRDQVTLTGSGEVIIEAFNDGNDNYLPASVQQSFVVSEPGKLPQTITMAELPDTVIIDEQVTLDITVSSGLNPDIDITGPATREGKTLTFTQADEVTVTIVQAGNDEYSPAPTVTHTITVIEPPVVELPLGATEQTLALEPVNDVIFGVEPFPLDVQTSSNLPVIFEVEGPAKISEGMLTVLGAGDITVRAFQKGNEEFAPSDTVVTTFTVNKAPQTITLELTPVNSNTFRWQAASDAGLTVSVKVTQGSGVIEGDILTVTSSEPVTVVAQQEGNENYEAAAPVSREVTVKLITSLGDNVDQLQVVFYPNPSSGVFNVDLPVKEKKISYLVYDLAGALIQQGGLSVTQSTVDLTTQREGTYLIQLRTTQGLQRYRLIKH